MPESGLASGSEVWETVGPGGQGESVMGDYIKGLSEDEIIPWRIKGVEELVRRGWKRAAIANMAGMGSSSALYGYIKEGGVVHGQFGYSLDKFIVEALGAGSPDDYKSRISAVAETPTKYPSRDRINQVRTGLKYLMDVVDDIDREMNENGNTTARAAKE